jgi:hypothetical protein
MGGENSEALKRKSIWALVAHTCNPSYSGGRDQEDHSSKPVQAKRFVRLYLKNNQHKKELVGGSRCRPSVQIPGSQKKGN